MPSQLADWAGFLVSYAKDTSGLTANATFGIEVRNVNTGEVQRRTLASNAQTPNQLKAQVDQIKKTLVDRDAYDATWSAAAGAQGGFSLDG